MKEHSRFFLFSHVFPIFSFFFPKLSLFLLFSPLSNLAFFFCCGWGVPCPFPSSLTSHATYFETNIFDCRATAEVDESEDRLSFVNAFDGTELSFDKKDYRAKRQVSSRTFCLVFFHLFVLCFLFVIDHDTRKNKGRPIIYLQPMVYHEDDVQDSPN